MRWIVGRGDGATVGEVVAKAGGDTEAVAEGRVFVGRRRARHARDPVREGDRVTVATPQGGRGEAATILGRSDDLVAVDKPAGVPTIADHDGAAHSLQARAARALGLPVARLHATSRLDRGVSGVVVFALTPEAAARLRSARDQGTYERRYVALAVRAPSLAEGVWDAAIGRVGDPRLRVVGGRDATPAETRYAVVASAPGGAAMLAVSPVTGRTHQIRVHASHAGTPLLGDGDYGGPARVTLPSGKVLAPGRVALHAARIRVPGLLVVSPTPVELEGLWDALGGAGAAWEIALGAP